MSNLAPENKIDRRTIVRTAANAAWAVPAIAVVSSAPAFAAASQPAKLTFTAPSATRSGRTGTFGFTVNNIGTEPTVALKLTLDVAAPLDFHNQPQFTAVNGWPRTGSGSTYTLTADTQIPAGGSATISGLSFRVNDNNTSFTLNITGTTTGGTGANTAITTP